MVRNNPLHERFTNIHQQTFLEYLDDFTVVDDEQELFQQLANCHDVVPWDAARNLGLLPGATYADAVELLSGRWHVT